MDQTTGSSSSSITKLKGKDNYPAWSTKLEALLDKLDLFDHIDATATAAAKELKDEPLAKWQKADRRAKTEVL